MGSFEEKDRKWIFCKDGEDDNKYNDGNKYKKVKNMVISIKKVKKSNLLTFHRLYLFNISSLIV